jgi:aminoglycoside phosphotransferase (APT) family kinase protein
METKQHPAGVDVDALNGWLDEHAATVASPVAVTPIAAGRSNLTYALVDSDGARFALRRPPLGPLKSTAQDVTREWGIVAAMAPTPVPTAAPGSSARRSS